MLFSERIALRKRLWWGKANKCRNWESYRSLFHRVADTHRLRSRFDDDVDWHCCDQWQRCLNNKWNAREFAARHACRIPKLYWRGRIPSMLPIATLPPRFVLRPAWGTHGVGTYVMVNGRDLLHLRDYSSAQLLDELGRRWAWFLRFPLLAEEFISDAPDREALPTEYKFYLFGERVAAINVVRRSGLVGRDGFYDEHWRRFPEPLETSNPVDEDLPAPRFLAEMLACARRLGRSCETFMRADFYSDATGPVFGEFSTTPVNGQDFSPWGDRYLGELWTACCGSRV